LRLANPIDHFSITGIDSFCRCPRKWFNDRLLREDPSTPRVSYFLFGEAMHQAMPILLTQSYHPIQAAIDKFEEIWDPNLEDDARNSDRAVEMLENAYEVLVANVRPFTLIEPPPEVQCEDASPWELEFKIDLGFQSPNVPIIPLIGRLDGICRDTTTGHLYIVEYKTSSEVSGRFFDCLRYSPQVEGYTWMARAKGLQVKGVYAVVLRVSKTNTETVARPLAITHAQTRNFQSWFCTRARKLLEYEAAEHYPMDFCGCSTMPQFGYASKLCSYYLDCHEGDSA
jgi:hypothetical protein